jgi:BMFP domain-containing protein YqiC
MTKLNKTFQVTLYYGVALTFKNVSSATPQEAVRSLDGIGLIRLDQELPKLDAAKLDRKLCLNYAYSMVRPEMIKACYRNTALRAEVQEEDKAGLRGRVFIYAELGQGLKPLRSYAARGEDAAAWSRLLNTSGARIKGDVHLTCANCGHVQVAELLDTSREALSELERSFSALETLGISWRRAGWRTSAELCHKYHYPKGLLCPTCASGAERTREVPEVQELVLESYKGLPALATVKAAVDDTLAPFEALSNWEETIKDMTQKVEQVLQDVISASEGLEPSVGAQFQTRIENERLTARVAELEARLKELDNR